MRTKLLLALLSVMLVAPGAHAVSLTPTSEIYGTVTDPDGAPMAACVSLFREDDFFPDDVFSTADGEYRFDVTPDRPYVIAVTKCSPGSRRFATEWYDDKLDDRDATFITVGAGERYRADIMMDHGGAARGRVTNAEGDPLEGMCVRMSRGYEQRRRWLPSEHLSGVTRTQADGTFHITGLRPDDYTITYEECEDSLTYAHQYYPGARTSADATRVRIVDREQTANLDAVMQVGARLSGTLSGPDGPAVACVGITDEHGDWLGGGAVENDGTYSTSLIAPGPTVVRFSGCEPATYDTEYYDDAFTLEDATVLDLAPGARVGGIDATLTVCERSPDIDEDGATECEEVAAGSDPWWRTDTDEDDLLDGEEIHTYRTSPIDNDTDGDSFGDGFEVRGGTCAGQTFEGGSDPNDPTSTPLAPGVRTTALRIPEVPRIC